MSASESFSSSVHEKLGSDDADIAVAAMVTTSSYKRISHSNPFLRLGPISGSLCGAAELQWLQVDIRNDVHPDELVKRYPASEHHDEDSSHEQFMEIFGVDWEAVMQEKFDPTLGILYDHLRELGTKPVQVHGSSPPGVYQGFPSTSEALPSTSDTIETSCVSTTPTRPRKRGLSSANITPEKDERRRNVNTAFKSESVSSTLPNLEPFSSPDLPKSSTSITLLATPQGYDEFESSVYASDPASDPISDLTYQLSSDPVPSSNISSSSNFDKSEDDVKAAARGFLRLMRSILLEIVIDAKDLNMNISAGPTLKFSVDGVIITTIPDLCLRITTKDDRAILDVLVECKRKAHHLTSNQIQAQVVCHLLGQAQHQMNLFRRKQSFQTFVFSWHHLHAYVSQASMTKTYLDTVALESETLGERLCVNSCTSFNIKSPAERINFARLMFRIIQSRLRPAEQAPDPVF